MRDSRLSLRRAWREGGRTAGGERGADEHEDEDGEGDVLDGVVVGQRLPLLTPTPLSQQRRHAKSATTSR
eukprot:2077202-Rhodomonas_salina.1